jgi:arylsulfatase A-like enzyme
MMIRTPNTIGGTVISEIVQNTDIYPTLLELTGTEQPEHIAITRVLIKVILNCLIRCSFYHFN